MTTVIELERLKQHALADPAREADYLRALLDATLYTHAPVSDDSGRPHFLMFTRPDGLTVIPVFTDLAPARDAARNAARVVSLPGRAILEATRGAILMLDPNEVSMTLYPEEIAALLDEGRAAVAPVAAEGSDLELQEPEPGDAWLMDLVATGLQPVAEVVRVHLAAARPRGSQGEADRFLVIAVVPPTLAERASRALAVALHGAGRVPRLPIDLAVYAPDEALGASMDGGLRASWTRELARAADSDRG